MQTHKPKSHKPCAECKTSTLVIIIKAAPFGIEQRTAMHSFPMDRNNGPMDITLNEELQTLKIDKRHESVITQMATDHRAQFSNRLG